MKLCLFCKKKETRRKFCSHACYSKSKIGEKHSWGAKIGDALRGKPKSAEHIRKVVLANTGQKRPRIQGEKHFNWKGDAVGYDALHDWVRSLRGVPKLCEDCGEERPKKVYHWANISGNYSRDINDWRRLCVPCHSQLDKNRGSLKKVFDMKTKTRLLVKSYN